MKNVLFLDTKDINRSCIAAALLHHSDPQITVSSAGPDPLTLNDFAIHSLQEIGVDSTSIPVGVSGSYLGQQFDLVITLCDGGTET